MKTPKIDWPNDKNTKKVLDETGMTVSEIEERIEDATARAEEMTRRGVAVLADALTGDRSTWERNWNRNTLLTTWFGEVNSAADVKDVHRRLDDVCDRLANKTLTYHIKEDLPKGFHAQNLGGPFSPNSFKVAPDWITKTVDDRAAVVTHELLHEWFKDHKIDGQSVYGADLAKQLARERPGDARRSPENYEQFVRELERLRDAATSGSTTKGSTTTGSTTTARRRR